MSTRDISHTLCSKLKQRREELGLTVQQAFEQTRVPIQYIIAFETGNFNKLPTNPNIQPFLYSYCNLLGVDPRPYYDLYLEWLRSHKEKEDKFAKDDISSFRETFVLPAWLEPVITWGIVCAILVLAWIAYTFLIQPIRDDPSMKATAGSLEAPAYHFEEDF